MGRPRAREPGQPGAPQLALPRPQAAFHPNPLAEPNHTLHTSPVAYLSRDTAQMGRPRARKQGQRPGQPGAPQRAQPD